MSNNLYLIEDGEFGKYVDYPYEGKTIIIAELDTEDDGGGIPPAPPPDC